jgi:hypothetical protein
LICSIIRPISVLGSLLGIPLLADDDRHHRPPRLGDRLQDPSQPGDIRPPVKVDQDDKDLIVC